MATVGGLLAAVACLVISSSFAQENVTAETLTTSKENATALMSQCVPLSSECNNQFEGNCCGDNECEFSFKDGRWICTKQCKIEGSMCQPAVPAYDECCAGSLCEYNDVTQMFACTSTVEPTTTTTQAPCREADSQCLVNGGDPCCGGLSCHSPWTYYPPVCTTGCASYGTMCGENTQCCFGMYCDQYWGCLGYAGYNGQNGTSAA